MSACLIGLGANLGDRHTTLDEAARRLAQQPCVEVVARSSWLETPPSGGPPGQPPYLNGALRIETSLAPEALLALLHAIEAALGRRRDQRWGPRTLDLDLLLYGDRVLSTPMLEVPHPRMAWRRFVLEPAAQVAGAMVHPTTGWTVARLLEHLNTTPWYVAITGSIGAGKSQLAEQIARQTGARLLAEQPDFRRLEAFCQDPASHAWEMELEFLRSRAGLLAREQPEWADQARATVSDFCFDQSAAFARVWLPAEQWDAYLAHWRRAAAGVVRPRLTVLIERTGAELFERIGRRGRACERGLGQECLEQIGLSIRRQATGPDAGPLLRLANVTAQAARDEVVAALEAMR
jgi:2-amino-4-hydroxy-6-hydroxymethyldihydropteridine diphosphokinase